MGNSQTSKQQPSKQKQQPLSKNFKQLVIGIISKCQRKGKMTEQQLIDKFNNQITNRSFGCLFGCFIGDALGAFCQFQTSTLSSKLLDDTMKMSGGGVFNLYKGQFTDDSQMAYHLLTGISKFSIDSPFNDQKQIIIAKIMEQYLRWRRSNPFDLGITCRKGIQVIHNNQNKLFVKQKSELKENVSFILSQVKKANDKSQSNGSLMRIAPLPIFFSFIDQNPILHCEFIKAQISIIHPNQLLQAAGYVWVKILYDLITRKNDEKQTYQRIYMQAKKLPQSQKILDWFKEAQRQQKMSATDNMGWAKIAWTYGMRIIYRMGRQLTKITKATIPDYVSEIKQVIREAGDSDTNAAIVGGLIGAIIGFQKLDIRYLENILSLRFPDEINQLHDRPKQYEPLSIFFQLLNFQQKCERYKKKNYKQSYGVPKGNL